MHSAHILIISNRLAESKRVRTTLIKGGDDFLLVIKGSI